MPTEPTPAPIEVAPVVPDFDAPVPPVAPVENPVEPQEPEEKAI
jgi:hypothetical protein